MNQACTTYQSDFTPIDWLQNNVIRDMDEFCSSENVDECLKYISQVHLSNIKIFNLNMSLVLPIDQVPL